MQEAEAMAFLKGLTLGYRSDYELKELYMHTAVAASARRGRRLDARTSNIEGFHEKLAQVEANRWMNEVVEGKSWTFKLVEIDKLVCLQKYINVGYAEKLSEGLDLTRPEVAIDFFLTDRYLPHVTKLGGEKSVNLYAIHSEGTDIRVLGSSEDVDAGDSSRVISFRVGWGPPQSQVVHLRDRYILTNGYHRHTRPGPGGSR